MVLNIERALDVLHSQGAIVEEVKLGWTTRLDGIALKHHDLEGFWSQRPPVGSACQMVTTLTESIALRAAAWC